MRSVRTARSRPRRSPCSSSHFKETNDRFGHALGNRVLKLFATTASAHLNGTSLVARLGGEGFAAILPGAGPLEALGAAEAVRHAFANSGAFVDALPVGATVSVGAVSDVGIKGDLNALFRRADAALYVAKRAGRNRVELLGPDDEADDGEVELRGSARRLRAGRAPVHPGGRGRSCFQTKGLRSLRSPLPRHHPHSRR